MLSLSTLSALEPCSRPVTCPQPAYLFWIAGCVSPWWLGRRLGSPFAENAMKRTVCVRAVRGRAAMLTAGVVLSLSGMVRAEGWDYYGNWGGPGHSGGEPIDALDRAYRRHDERYSRDGWVMSGRADAQLMEEATAASLNPFNDTRMHGRVLGPLSVAAFAVKPSVYKARVFGQAVPIPADGASAFAIHQVERGVSGAKRVGRKTVGGAKRLIKKVF